MRLEGYFNLEGSLRRMSDTATRPESLDCFSLFKPFQGIEEEVLNLPFELSPGKDSLIPELQEFPDFFRDILLFIFLRHCAFSF